MHGYAVPGLEVLETICMKTKACLETLLNEDRTRIGAHACMLGTHACLVPMLHPACPSPTHATTATDPFDVMRPGDLDGRSLLSRILGLDCVADPAAIEPEILQANAKTLKKTRSKAKLDSTLDRKRAENFSTVRELRHGFGPFIAHSLGLDPPTHRHLCCATCSTSC